MKTGEVEKLGKDFTGGYFNELLKTAVDTMNKAYAPYSHYKVGTAVVDERGVISIGCNVENAAYTGTHSEEAAIAAMIASGGTTIKGLVCVTANGGASCGNCRQRIWEFCGHDSELMCYFIDLNRDEVQLISIGHLLPFAFELRKPVVKKTTP